jgi:hypothetical protein
MLLFVVQRDDCQRLWISKRDEVRVIIILITTIIISSSLSVSPSSSSSSSSSYLSPPSHHDLYRHPRSVTSSLIPLLFFLPGQVYRRAVVEASERGVSVRAVAVRWDADGQRAFFDRWLPVF